LVDGHVHKESRRNSDRRTEMIDQSIKKGELVFDAGGKSISQIIVEAIKPFQYSKVFLCPK